MEPSDKTEAKETDANRPMTRSGRGYGPQPPLIREARFAPEGLTGMQRTLSEVSLTRSVAPTSSARSSIQATFGSSAKDATTDFEMTKTTWIDNENSIMSSTIVPKATAATKSVEYDEKFASMQAQTSEMAKAMATLCSKMSETTTNKEKETENKPPSKGAFSRPWTDYRASERYRSTETVASGASQQWTRLTKPGERLKLKLNRREADERTMGSDEDPYDPNPYAREYQKREPQPEIRFATRSETRGKPFDDLKYTGYSDKKHPMRFLDEFEEIADHEGMSTKDRFYFFKRCLVGKARDWYENQEFRKFDEAAMKFAFKYWGRTEQQQLRDKLRSDIYRPNTGRSMAEHAQKLARDAKYLTLPYNDEEMMEMISLHFPVEIFDDLAIERVSSMEEMIHRLQVLEHKSQNKAQIDKARRRFWKFEEEEKRRTRNPQRETNAEPRTHPPLYDRRDNAKKFQGRFQSKNRYESPERHEIAEELSVPKYQTRKRPDTRYMGNERNTRERSRSLIRRTSAQRREVETRNYERPTDRTDQVPRERTTGRTQSGNAPNREYEPQNRERSTSRARQITKSDITQRREPSKARSESKEVVQSLRTDEMINELRNTQYENAETINARYKVPMTRIVVIAQTSDTKTASAPIEALLDTGAIVSAIKPETIESLQHEMPDAKVRQIKINKTHVRGAFAQKGVIADKIIQLVFSIKEKEKTPRTYSHEFYQVEGLYVPIILGADFLEKHEIT